FNFSVLKLIAPYTDDLHDKDYQYDQVDVISVKKADMASIITNTSIRKINSILKLSNNESNIPSESALFYNINKILKTFKETLINDIASFN
ncbi:hypothetical protein A3Q56_08722, partial [Intoshia linei]